MSSSSALDAIGIVGSLWGDFILPSGRPPRVFHYTDSAGLLGIVSSQELWASALQSSNDPSEGEYAYSLAYKMLEDYLPSATSTSGSRQMHYFLSEATSSPDSHIGWPFIFSLCENGNLLSQWRTYGRRSGYSIAFDSLVKDDILDLTAPVFRVIVGRVIYEKAAQLDILKKIYDKAFAVVDQIPNLPSSHSQVNLLTALHLLVVIELSTWAACSKHATFSEEREWRVIAFSGPTFGQQTIKDLANIKFRANSEQLIPYVVLKAKSEKLPISGVTCGPGTHQNLSVKHVNALLIKHGYTVPVEISDSPART